MQRYWSEKARQVQPYVPGEQPRKPIHIKLNTNENPAPPAPSVLRAIEAELRSLNKYPLPDALPFREAISAREKLPTDWIFAGNGSDEVLAIAWQAFFDDARPVCFPELTYSFYPVYAQLYGTPYTRLPMGEEGRIDLDAFPDTASAVLANPNAPTGRAVSLAEIEALAERLRRAGNLLLVDEAYVEFGAQSARPLLERYDNLLIVRTLSKSHSLAGLRVGYALGQPALIEALNRIKDCFNSYPLDRLAIVGGAAALRDEAYFAEARDAVIETRVWFCQRLTQLGFTYPPTLANFVFCRHAKLGGGELYAKLRERSILVRHFFAPELEAYNRITIGSRADMEAVVRAMEEILREV